MPAGNPENMKPARPGEVRNPSGRPKGSPNRSTVARKWLAAREKKTNPMTGSAEWLTQEDIVTLSMIARARGGNVAAYKALMEQAYGLNKRLELSIDQFQKEPDEMSMNEIDVELKIIEEKLKEESEFDDFEEIT